MSRLTALLCSTRASHLRVSSGVTHELLNIIFDVTETRVEDRIADRISDLVHDATYEEKPKS